MYAERVSGLKSSAIREILKITMKPGMISFAGGLPSADLFPLQELKEAAERALSRYGAAALQYTVTEGIPQLRERIAKMIDAGGSRIGPGNVLVTQGSQQALDLLSKLFLDKGAEVLTENPSYLGALQAFRLFQANVRPVPSDGQGVRTGALRDALAGVRPAFLYLMPNYQNPTGVSLSAGRRRELAEIAAESGLIIVEDDPYGALGFEGKRELPLFTLGSLKNFIYLSSFSKTIAPGLRVAFVIAGEEIIAKLAQLKQGTDLQTNTLGQYIVHEYFERADHEGHLDKLRDTYRERRDRMLSAMERHVPKTVTWNRPEGGMFLWAKLPDGMDANDLLARCIGKNVAFVPGSEFFPDGSGRNTMRLNFSNAGLKEIDEGIRRMGDTMTNDSVQIAGKDGE